MPSSKDIEDYLASREILTSNIDLFHRGSRALYRVIAVELRKLLCDGRNDKNSLIPRIFTDFSLYPLFQVSPDFPREGLVFLMPSFMQANEPSKPRVVSLFAFDKGRIPLDDWLKQKVFLPNISIRDLIRSVADRESAHSDKDYDDTLKLTRSVTVFDEDLHKTHIIAIGEYLLQEIEATIRQFPDTFSR